MKKYVILPFAALLLTGCGARNLTQDTAADVAAESGDADMQDQAKDTEGNAALDFASAAEQDRAWGTDDAGRTGYYDENGSFIPDPNYSVRPPEESVETYTEANESQPIFQPSPYDEDEWHHLSAAEYFESLSIRPMPDPFDELTLTWDPDAEYDIRGRYAFLYFDEADKKVLTVYLSLESEFELEDGEILMHHADDGQAADFCVGKAHVTVLGNGMTTKDLDTLKTYAQDLQKYLPLQ